MYGIISSDFIITALTASSSLSCDICANNNALLISGQFGLNAIVTKTFEGSTLLILQ